MGSFLKYANPKDKNFTEVSDRKAMITGYMVLVMLAILVMFILLIWLRKKIFDDAEMVDNLAWTPSDFCLKGNCPDFSTACDYSNKSIEEEVIKHMKEKFEAEVEYVNVSYDIENIYELMAKE